MDINKIVGWLLVVYSAWSLLFGVITNDMNGLASLGYNPDAPMSVARAFSVCHRDIDLRSTNLLWLADDNRREIATPIILSIKNTEDS